MTNFSIAAIMNNERGSGLIRPTPMTENTKLGNYFKSSFAPQMSPKEPNSNNEEDVDVEQWSDGEDQKSSQSPISQSSLETNSNKNPTQSPKEIPKKKKKEDKPKFLKPKCNRQGAIRIRSVRHRIWRLNDELG